MYAMLEGLELMQYGVAVEGADVLGLRLREATHGPREMHEVWLDGMREWMHSDFVRPSIALASIAGRAGGDDVAPIVLSATRHGDDMVARERFTRPELGRRASAVLTAVVISREQKRVRHLAAETARDVDELRQPNHGGAWHGHALGANDLSSLRFDDFRLSVDDEPQSPTHGDHGQGLE